jgi:tRNA pseudouridine55 synthase
MKLTPGIYPIFKPVGITSHDVIYQIRKLTGIQRVGHAGTLDPLASGVLVVAVGREYTKQLDQLMNTDKQYIAEITLGMTSTTDDAEGEKKVNQETEPPHIKRVQNVLKNWVGKVDQLPPIYSSIKIQGKPAHRRVRRGQVVELEPRKVQIDSIELLEYNYPLLRIKVQCGKGVYIRSLARDIGKVLGVGGYLSALERTRVGQFRIEDAIKLQSTGQSKNLLTK